MSSMNSWNNIKKLSMYLRDIVINGIKECNKLDIFVFDEIHSVSAEVFQGLSDLFDPRGYITLDPISNERLYTTNVYY